MYFQLCVLYVYGPLMLMPMLFDLFLSRLHSISVFHLLLLFPINFTFLSEMIVGAAVVVVVVVIQSILDIFPFVRCVCATLKLCALKRVNVLYWEVCRYMLGSVQFCLVRFWFWARVKLMPLAIGMFVCRKRMKCQAMSVRERSTRKTNQNSTDLFILNVYKHYTHIHTSIHKRPSWKGIEKSIVGVEKRIEWNGMEQNGTERSRVLVCFFYHFYIKNAYTTHKYGHLSHHSMMIIGRSVLKPFCSFFFSRKTTTNQLGAIE